MIIVKDKAKNSPLFIPRNTITTITNTNNSGGGNGIDINELNKYLADYVTEEELKNKNYATITALSDKQDKLVSGDNIKTINGKSILGEGNITIQGEGGNMDLSEYITKTELDKKGYLTSIPSEYVTETELLGKDYATNTTVNSKQDELVSGQNIKTINGTSILGSGNITIQGGTSVDLSNYVTKTELNSKGYITEIPSEYITESELSNKGYITGIPSEYITETELNNKGYATTEALNGKQEKLTSGDNIKTINGQSILGKGNITIEGGNGNGNANIVELTQDEYDNLEEKDENTIYVITDAPAIDTPDTSIFITESELLEMGYATQGYVDEKLGDIETILNNIIGQE